MDYRKAIEVLKAERKFSDGGVFVFLNCEYQSWINELRDAWSFVPGCIAVDESGRMWEAIGGDDDQGAEIWQEVKQEKRGGPRPGSGRKPMKPGLKKLKKAFSLSPETVQALEYLQKSLGLGSQSAVVDYLALKAFRESVRSDREVVEHQRDLF